MSTAQDIQARGALARQLLLGFASVSMTSILARHDCRILDKCMSPRRLVVQTWSAEGRCLLFGQLLCSGSDSPSSDVPSMGLELVGGSRLYDLRFYDAGAMRSLHKGNPTTGTSRSDLAIRLQVSARSGFVSFDIQAGYLFGRAVGRSEW